MLTRVSVPLLEAEPVAAIVPSGETATAATVPQSTVMLRSKAPFGFQSWMAVPSPTASALESGA